VQTQALACLLEESQVAARKVPEPGPRAGDHDARAQPPDEHFVDEPKRSDRSERPVESRNHQKVNACLADQCGLLGVRGQQRHANAAQHNFRDRIERQRNRAQALLPSKFHRAPQERLVAQVHAVEHAESNARRARLCPAKIPQDAHVLRFFGEHD